MSVAVTDQAKSTVAVPRAAHEPRKLRLVILDDSVTDAQLMIRFLTAAGFTLDYEVVSTAPGFKRALARRPDMILADYHVPGFGAPQALEMVKQGGSVAPVIVLSGVVGEETVAQCIKAGAHDYLLKDRLIRLGPAVTNALRDWQLEQDKALLELHQVKAADQLLAIVQRLTDGVLTVAGGPGVESANPAARRMFGLAADLGGVRVNELFRIATGKEIRFELPEWDLLPRWTEVRGVRQDGSTFAGEWCVSRVGQESAVVFVRDVTRRKAVLSALKSKALHDFLTGLPNRALFANRLEHAIADSKRSGMTRAMMLVDLDDFKNVNDTLGHTAGDALLRIVANRLTKVLRATDTVARLGGDEFGILLAGATSMEQSLSVAHKIDECLRQPVEISGSELTVAGSIGIALCPDNGTDVDGLMARADEAMYHAKRQSIGFSMAVESQMESVKDVS